MGKISFTDDQFDTTNAAYPKAKNEEKGNDFETRILKVF